MFIHQNTMWVPIELADKGVGLIKGEGTVDFVEDAIDLAGENRAIGGIVSNVPGCTLGVAGEVKRLKSIGRLPQQQGDPEKDVHKANIAFKGRSPSSPPALVPAVPPSPTLRVWAKKSPVAQATGPSMNMAATYSPALWCSTIGHEGLNFSVRYGKR